MKSVFLEIKPKIIVSVFSEILKRKINVFQIFVEIFRVGFVVLSSKLLLLSTKDLKVYCPFLWTRGLKGLMTSKFRENEFRHFGFPLHS